MNHRELILSADKKARFAFLSLPEDLQDEIVDGLDGQGLTLQSASALTKARGHSLSHEAIAGYYRALRMERRLLDSRQELSRIIAVYAGKPEKEALECLRNLTIAMATTGLIDGTVGIAKIDLPKLVEAYNKGGEQKGGDGKSEEKQAPVEKEAGLSGDVAKWIREEVLGVKKQQ